MGIVLHPHRDSAEAVNTILTWAAARGVTVLGLDQEIGRLDGVAVIVSPVAMADQADLLVALGGDGTVLRAMRLSDGRRAVVLGVNLGKLGFLAEVDVPDLSAALTAISDGDYKIEIRAALDAVIGAQRLTAFNDIVVVRVPGEGSAAIVSPSRATTSSATRRTLSLFQPQPGQPLITFRLGPIVAPSVPGILVTPSAPHSVFNRSVMIDQRHTISLRILPSSGRLAVEVDGMVATYVTAGDDVVLTARADGSKVVRLGRTTFYQRAQRKLGVASSTELNASPPGTATTPASSPPPGSGWSSLA